MCCIGRSGGLVMIIAACAGAVAIGAASFLSAPLAFAQDAKAAEPPKHDAHMDEGMKQWMEMNKVGDDHKAMEFMVGTWSCVMNFKMTPDMPTQESNGTQVNTWVLDNRFIKTDFTGDMAPGMSFTGVGYTGYNTMRKMYEGVWVDSTTNSISMSTGTYDAAKKVMSMSGEADDMMTGKRKTQRSEYINTGADTYELKMYDNGPDGKEFVTLHIAYTRKK
jgi:hypothetical protein